MLLATSTSGLRASSHSVPLLCPVDYLRKLTLRWACSLEGNRHLYTADLLKLEACGSVAAPDQSTGPALKSCCLPLDHWEPFLHTHPDHAFAAYIRRGLRDGFRIGVPPEHRSQLRPAVRNHPSANAAPKEVARQLSVEVNAGRLRPAEGACHISPIGLVPKSGHPHKWRLIVDLSSPRTASVNDGIHTDLCSLKYAAIDQALLFIDRLGRGTILAKLTSKAHTGWCPSTPAISIYWVSTFKDRPTPTQPCPSASALHQKSFLQSLIL